METSVKEELGALDGAQLYAAANERSAVFDGLVLAAAMRIVISRLRISQSELCRRTQMGRTTFYRWAKGGPIQFRRNFQQALTSLALVLLDGGE